MLFSLDFFPPKTSPLPRLIDPSSGPKTHFLRTEAFLRSPSVPVASSPRRFPKLFSVHVFFLSFFPPFCLSRRAVPSFVFERIWLPAGETLFCFRPPHRFSPPSFSLRLSGYAEFFFFARFVSDSRSFPSGWPFSFRVPPFF